MSPPGLYNIEKARRFNSVALLDDDLNRSSRIIIRKGFELLEGYFGEFSRRQALTFS